MYVLIQHYDENGQVIGSVRCQKEHIDKHPTPFWVHHADVSEIKESVPKLVPVITVPSPKVTPYKT